PLQTPANASCAAEKPTAARSRDAWCRCRMADGWPALRLTAPLPTTDRAHATHARSAAAARQERRYAPPSQTDPGPFTGGSSARRISLAFARLSDQVPETGLQRRTPACEVQPAPCQLL